MGYTYLAASMGMNQDQGIEAQLILPRKSRFVGNTKYKLGLLKIFYHWFGSVRFNSVACMIPSGPHSVSYT